MSEFPIAKGLAESAVREREAGNSSAAAILDAAVPVAALAEAHVEACQRFMAGMVEASAVAEQTIAWRAAQAVEAFSAASPVGVSRTTGETTK